MFKRKASLIPLVSLDLKLKREVFNINSSPHLNCSTQQLGKLSFVWHFSSFICGWTDDNGI